MLSEVGGRERRISRLQDRRIWKPLAHTRTTTSLRVTGVWALQSDPVMLTGPNFAAVVT